MSCILFILNSKKQKTVNRQFFLVIFGNTKFCFIKDKKVKKSLIKRNETIFYIDDKTSKDLDEKNVGYKIMKEVLSKPINFKEYENMIRGKIGLNSENDIIEDLYMIVLKY